jgi:segregation and condensation protein B
VRRLVAALVARTRLAAGARHIRKQNMGGPRSASGVNEGMNTDELKPLIESLIFVSEEPISLKQLATILQDEQLSDIEKAAAELMEEFNTSRGLELRKLAGGYKITTRPEYSEYVKRYLKAQPSARLSMAALETLAVIAYKQPITIPEILEARGVTSTSAIKTLLDRRLILARGHKEVVGRPMLYGTSKEFLIQFGLNDLSELPNLEDFEDLVSS